MTDETNPALGFAHTQELLESILNIGLSFICVKDREGRFVYANDLHATLYHTTPENLIGKTAEPWVGREQFEEWLKEDLKVMDSGQRKHYDICPRSGTDMVVRWFDTVKVPFKDKIGNRDLLLVIHRDVTSVKKADQEKEVLRQQMMTSQKMETIGLLAGSVAHDFNNLLTIIMAASRFLSNDGNLTPEANLLIQAITKSAERAAEVVSRLLILARKDPMAHSHLELNQRLMEILPLLKSTLNDNISLTVELGNEPTLINGNASLIQEALVNLILNSRQALPGGGEILIKTYWSADEKGKEQVILEIRDTGVGMDEETKKKAFDPFFTTRPVGQGSGLGLAIVQRIMEQHGGNVRVKSKPTEGTSIYLDFPRLDIVELAPISSPQLKWVGKTVLLAEDEKMLRLLISKSLHALGMKVIEADSGDAAWKLFQQWRDQIDCLVTDVVMPGELDGVSLRKKIYAERKEIPAIIMSGYSFDYNLNKDSLPNRTEFLPKPFVVEGLQQKILAMLGE